jgi:hypothetical protein
MLVVVAGSIGVWLALAETVAPGRATAVVQAMVNGARDRAVSGETRPVYVRLVFSNSYDPNKDENDGLTQYECERGTEMYLKEYALNPSSNEYEWKRIPNRPSENVGRQVFVLTGAPDLSSVTVPSVAADAENPDALDVAAWQTYRDTVAKKMAQLAFTGVDGTSGYLGASSAFRTGQDQFCLTFDSTGSLVPPGTEIPADPQLPGLEGNPTCLTIVELAGRRIGEYEFYVLHPNTGMRLVFD